MLTNIDFAFQAKCKKKKKNCRTKRNKSFGYVVENFVNERITISLSSKFYFLAVGFFYVVSSLVV